MPDRDALYFEDFTVGRRFRSRGITLSEADILEFAQRYDPQPFHIDAVAAAASPYEGLIASGFHTLAAGFRMIVQQNIFTASSMGSPGMDALRWLQPVRPGDTLSTEIEVTEHTPSRSRPDRGRITVAYTIRNQREEPVMTFTAVQILRTRPAE